MRDNEKQSAIILSVIGIVPVVWLALLIAPSVKGGLPEILPSLMNVFNNPFHIEVCEDSVKTVLILLLCYGMGIGIYFSTQRNYRRREEHGSAKWGNARAVDKKYRQGWNCVRDEYIKLKNRNRDTNKKSFILYLESIHNVYNHIQQGLENEEDNLPRGLTYLNLW